MKKAILLLFILIIGLSNSFAQGNKAFFNRALKEKERLKYKENNIRGCVDYTYNYNEGQKDDSVRHYRIVKIDTSGNVIMIADFDQDRKFETLTKFIYNDMNEEIVSFYIEEGQLKYKTNNYYDLNNELIECIITTEFGSIHKKISYYYNSGNRITHFKIVGPSGNIISKGKLKYNENKLPRECKTYKGNSVISEYEFKYNNDLIIEESYSEPDAELHRNIQYFYKKDMIDSSFLKLNSVESFNKRKYFTFGQKKRNIEKWLVIPDFSKYYKVYNNTQKFVYETPPQFPGGKQALIKYIDENLKYPKKAMKAGIEGLVIVSFVIDATGTTGNIRVNKGIDYELDNAAGDLVKKMPKWKPALNSNGKETMSSFELPVNFVIE